MTPMKSPLRQVRPAGITKNQKATIIENLNLEITERARKLRAQYTMQARSLKQRIEMRINRVPKKLWGMKMGDLLAQHSNRNKEPKAILPKLGLRGVKGFVEDVKRLSNDGNRQPDVQPERLIVPKKRVAKKPVGTSAREKMPPPPLPAHPSSGPSLSPGKPSLPPSSSPARPLPAKKTVGRTTRKVPSNGSIASASTRPSSRATTRSSLETIATSAGSSQEVTKATKSSQAKGKAASTMTANTANTGLKRGGVKGNPSSGSLKENKVAGVKEKPSSSKVTKKEAAAPTGGRILRSRK
ncbi:Borealin N terminal-domain-containing protein [Tuber brumale]|nr:Borealin N terminal-domain-containing protein [Tuber brumale]